MVELTDLCRGDKAQVVGFKSANKAYRQQLMAMGLTRGVIFEVLRVAPLGDPIEIQVRGFSLCLRKGEASSLRLERWG